MKKFKCNNKKRRNTINSLLKLLILFFLITSNAVYAQNILHCVTDEVAQEHNSDTEIQEKRIAIEQHSATYTNSDVDISCTTVIPVVFHVYIDYNNSYITNVSDEQILAQLKQLNDDFGRTNSDANDDWSQAADTKIQFCLATKDPDGNSTTGINRYSEPTGTYTVNQIDANIKPGTIWDSEKYLNIWIIHTIVLGSNNNVLGYGQYPGFASNTDGVVIKTHTVGSLDMPWPLANYYLDFEAYKYGRTLTHEVGHWLNLIHKNIKMNNYVWLTMQ